MKHLEHKSYHQISCVDPLSSAGITCIHKNQKCFRWHGVHVNQSPPFFFTETSVELYLLQSLVEHLFISKETLLGHVLLIVKQFVNSNSTDYKNPEDFHVHQTKLCRKTEDGRGLFSFTLNTVILHTLPDFLEKKHGYKI